MAKSRRPAPPEIGLDQYRICPGTLVDVALDDGTVQRTFARSDPWKLGSGDWVVSVVGISGGYALERVKPVPRMETSDAF